jgi:putative hydrolase of the HAD superfamily
MIKAVMFDFSGTLLRIEPVADWLRAAVEEAGLTVAESELHACAVLLERFGACPGGPLPQVVPAGMESLWQERDLSAEQHHAAYTGLARHAALPAPELADLLYDRSCRPVAWQPYPDSAPTLKELRRRGIPVAVVSNIGWDLRPVFMAHGLDPLIDF